MRLMSYKFSEIIEITFASKKKILRHQKNVANAKYEIANNFHINSKADFINFSSAKRVLTNALSYLRNNSAKYCAPIETDWHNFYNPRLFSFDFIISILRIAVILFLQFLQSIFHQQL